MDPSIGHSEYCGNLPSGSACGIPSNSKRDYDVLCSGGICLSINGTCSDQKLEDEEPCWKDDDCVGGACGKMSYAKGASKMCCKGGEKRYVVADSSWGGADYFCGGLQDGTPCGVPNDVSSDNDKLCSSQICLTVNGTCSGRKLEDLEPCNENDDCAAGACGWDSYEKDAPKVCCPDGEMYLLGGNDKVCGGLPEGKACRDTAQSYRDYNNICSNKNCTEGICS